MGLEQRIRLWLENGERIGFRLGAMVVFGAVVLGLVVLAVAANSVLLGVLSAVVLGIILREFLPEDRIQSWARSYATGEAGDRWRRRYDRWLRRLGRLVPW
ncbi:hypothetical protein [Haloferax sulfurifontis]|nr:hypothetical protein [Haloferax sulfurifontis]